MSVALNDDFRYFVLCLNEFGVEYLIVGGYAVIHYGHSRTTGDIDIWARRTKDNYLLLLKAFRKFGLPVFDMTEKNFLENEAMDVFSFGRPPVSIDILTEVKGLQFEEAYKNSVQTVWNDVPVNVIDIRDLIIAKKAAGRNKDLDDLENIGK